MNILLIPVIIYPDIHRFPLIQSGETGKELAYGMDILGLPVMASFFCDSKGATK